MFFVFSFLFPFPFFSLAERVDAHAHEHMWTTHCLVTRIFGIKTRTTENT